VERRQSDEANKYMGRIRGHDDRQKPMDKLSQNAQHLLFFVGHPGIFKISSLLASLKPLKAVTWFSQEFSHPGTNQALPCLALVGNQS